MANICNAFIKAVGDKKDLNDLKNLLDENSYDHFFESNIEKFDNTFAQNYDVGARWSVEGYLLDIIKEFSENKNIKIGIYSEEIGMEFSEHMLIKNGKCLLNEVNDYEVIYFDDLEDAKDFNENLTEDDLGHDIFLKYPEYFTEEENEFDIVLDDEYINNELKNL